MQEVINTEQLTITVNPLKNRLYCVMQGFWQYEAHKAEQMRSVFQQLYREQIMHGGTVVLDTTGLHLMQPQVADRFLPALTKCLLEHRIKALAHVENPDNVVLKMQFHRVLTNVEKAHEIKHKTFHEQQDAETWLDTL